jgi:HlyD family secretion protein
MDKKTAAPTTVVRPTSAEQLDRLVTVTAPAGWIALGAAYILIIATLIWGIWGSVPTKVKGQGILLRTGGVYDVVVRGWGQVADILVRVGDLVKTGQVVARVIQPDLAAQIENARRDLESLVQQNQQLKEVFARELALQKKNFQAQRHNLDKQITDIKERQTWLKQRLRAQKILLAKGLITEKTLVDTKENLQAAMEDQRRSMIKVEQVNEQTLQLESRQERDLFNSRLRILEAQNKLGLLKEKLGYTSQVVSDISGRVLEVTARQGRELIPGDIVVVLEPLQKALRSVIYIPTGRGGMKVKEGMEVQLSPSTVKRDRYGYMLGRVSIVSPYPATQAAMMDVLGNQGLVKEFSKDGPPMVVYADLAPEPNTPSGFKWSSREGPPYKVDMGTVLQAELVVRKQRPISLLIPYLKGFFGL